MGEKAKTLGGEKVSFQGVKGGKEGRTYSRGEKGVRPEEDMTREKNKLKKNLKRGDTRYNENFKSIVKKFHKGGYRKTITTGAILMRWVPGVNKKGREGEPQSGRQVKKRSKNRGRVPSLASRDRFA